MMSRILGLAAAILVVLAAARGASAAPVRVDGGLVEGASEQGLEVFKGVPFAAAPVGDLRWRPPAPVTPWTGVRKAAAFAPACMQTGVSMPGETPPKVSEDCLYLNIWAPKAAAKLPVIVWIPGGGFTNGSASMPLYAGDRLAERDVVVVTVAYRLGPLGFLAHPELSAESPKHASGDYGLMDQIAALRWVKRNIAAFGGDPTRVTVAGQSAGSMSVSLLMASPRAAGLFQRAIGESGGDFEPVALAPDYLLHNAEKSGEAYAASLGAHSLADLRRLPADALLKGQAARVSHPVLDGDVLSIWPYDAFAQGRQNDVPILIGSNAEEARSLSDFRNVTAANFQEDLKRRWGQLPPPLAQAYPFKTDEEARQAMAHFERDLRFGWDMWAWARLQARTGKGRVYYYHFTQNPPFPAGSVYAGWGPSHFAELWYTFDHLDQSPFAWTTQDRQLAEVMARYWTNFARSGDPNGPGLPPWPAFTNEEPRVLRLGDPIEIGGVPNLESLEVFDAVYGQLRAAQP
jgi:para-nitrobenzyl esterase